MSTRRVKAHAQDRSEEDRFAGWVIFSAALIGCALFLISGAFAAVGDIEDAAHQGRHSEDIITGSIPDGATAGTNVRMQFFQQDGPRAGHVKVVLTPDDRPLTLAEAHSAARQAFLETLNDPVFMDDLKIVTIIVHRFPDQVDPVLDFAVRFRSQGEGKWSIQDEGLSKGE